MKKQVMQSENVNRKYMISAAISSKASLLKTDSISASKSSTSVERKTKASEKIITYGVSKVGIEKRNNFLFISIDRPFKKLKSAENGVPADFVF